MDGSTRLMWYTHTYTHTQTAFQHFLWRNMNTVSRKSHFGHPVQHFISFESGGRAQPSPDAHHYKSMSMRCKWQGCIVRLAVPCDTSEWVAGVCRGKDGSIHKAPLKDCKLGRRLALVLLPFHGTAGGGCSLVLTEWNNSFTTGERRSIITVLHFLQSVEGHCVHSCTCTSV